MPEGSRRATGGASPGSVSLSPHGSCHEASERSPTHDQAERQGRDPVRTARPRKGCGLQAFGRPDVHFARMFDDPFDVQRLDDLLASQRRRVPSPPPALLVEAPRVTPRPEQPARFDRSPAGAYRSRAMDEAPDPELDDAIRSMPQWQGRDLEVTPITAGITNRNFLISAGNERFVLRLAGRDTDLLGIDREAEVEAGRAASAAGVGPEILVWMPGTVLSRHAIRAGRPDLRGRPPAIRDPRPCHKVRSRVPRVPTDPLDVSRVSHRRGLRADRGRTRREGSGTATAMRTPSPNGSRQRSRAHRCPSRPVTTIC